MNVVGGLFAYLKRMNQPRGGRSPVAGHLPLGGFVDSASVELGGAGSSHTHHAFGDARSVQTPVPTLANEMHVGVTVDAAATDSDGAVAASTRKEVVRKPMDHVGGVRGLSAVRVGRSRSGVSTVNEGICSERVSDFFRNATASSGVDSAHEKSAAVPEAGSQPRSGVADSTQENHKNGAKSRNVERQSQSLEYQRGVSETNLADSSSSENLLKDAHSPVRAATCSSVTGRLGAGSLLKSEPGQPVYSRSPTRPREILATTDVAAPSAQLEEYLLLGYVGGPRGFLEGRCKKITRWTQVRSWLNQ
ncbi:unnamed protein product, partial [Amoebophrya sp. A25]